MMSFTLIYIILNIVGIILIRYIENKRERVVFITQVIIYIGSNLILYLNQKVSLIDKINFTILTTWLSIVFLEIWAMSDDSYSLAVLLLINEKINLKKSYQEIDEIILSKKNTDRLNTILKLKLVENNSSNLKLTFLGNIVLSSINVLKKIMRIH